MGAAAGRSLKGSWRTTPSPVSTPPVRPRVVKADLESHASLGDDPTVRDARRTRRIRQIQLASVTTSLHGRAGAPYGGGGQPPATPRGRANRPRRHLVTSSAAAGTSEETEIDATASTTSTGGGLGGDQRTNGRGPRRCVGAPQKAALARDITDVHVKVTGAPASIVHVVFLTTHRTGATRSSPVRRGQGPTCRGRCGPAATPRQRRHCWSLRETPGRLIMEGGRIMSDPGREDDLLRSR